MEVLVRNAEGNLKQKDRDYAAKKLGKLDRYFGSARRVEIVHKEEKHEHVVEITVFADGHILRGEEQDESVTAAIDKVADKMENRLRRLKSRLVKSHRKRGLKAPIMEEQIEDDHEEADGVPVDVKKFLLKPMSVEEAALQMEMVGHPFFVFMNEETKQTEVLYKRKNGHYGLLSPGAE
ncbi:MAG: ribosome hibernation-promoting factor, HPF/YfiA family [Fimbriimonadaceae bacterium]